MAALADLQKLASDIADLEPAIAQIFAAAPQLMADAEALASDVMDGKLGATPAEVGIDIDRWRRLACIGLTIAVAVGVPIPPSVLAMVCGPSCEYKPQPQPGV